MTVWFHLSFWIITLTTNVLSICNHGSDEIYFCSSLNQLSTNSIPDLSFNINFNAQIYSFQQLQHLLPTNSINNLNAISFGKYISCFLIPDDSSSKSSSSLQSCHIIESSSTTIDTSLCMYHIRKISPLAVV